MNRPRLLISSMAVLISVSAGVYLGPKLRAALRESPGAKGTRPEFDEGQMTRRANSRATEPPRFASSGAGILAVDPLHAAYDAAKLATAEVKAPAEIFRAEPRDARWAPSMETALSRFVSADLAKLVPAARSLTFECRTQTCRIEAQVATPEDMRKAYFALQIGSLGKVVSFTPQKRPFDGVVEVYALQTASSREIVAWERYNREKRKVFLEDLRRSKPPSLPIPIEDLPAE